MAHKVVKVTVPPEWTRKLLGNPLRRPESALRLEPPMPGISLITMVPQQLSTATALSELIMDYLTALSPTGLSRGLLGSVIGTAIGSRASNQDRAAVLSFLTRTSTIQIGVLADGIGGMLNGDECASAVVAAFSSAAYVAVHSGERDPDRIIENASRFANAYAYRRFRGRAGSTLAAYIAIDNIWAYAYAGDSKVFAFTKKHELESLSVDDTMAARFDTLPGLDPSFRNSRGLLQYVGMGDDFKVHVHRIEAARYVYLLLASDGINATPLETVHQLLSAEVDPITIVRRLTAISTWVPNADNCTVILTSMPPKPLTQFSGLSLEDVNGCFIIPHRELMITAGARSSDIQQPSESAMKTQKRRKKASKADKPPARHGERPSLQITE
jgi:PPM family protein phosphatase